MAVVLGIDGGGTKTTCAIARDGHLIAKVSTRASNLVRSSEEDVRTALLGAIRSACQSAEILPSHIEAASIGVGGASRENISNRIHQIVRESLKCPVEVVGDIIVAYEAAMRGGHGVVVIAGTGSIAYGRNERQDSARAGGWGSIISDEGSGYWIGKNAVRAAFRAIDSETSTVLMRNIMEQWKVITRDDLLIAANANPQPKFAELAPAVFNAAAEGDTIAQELLTDAGIELATLAKLVIRRLWPGDHSVQVAALGGIFTHSPFIYKVFENSIRSERVEAIVRLLDVDPVQGALYRAEQLLLTSRAAGEQE